MQQKIFHLHALSALHVGTGQSVGVVDLPIARARATNLPLVPGSALKGVLRDEFAQLPGVDMRRIKTLFGPESALDGDIHAGALAVGDAHLLILPIRSFNGVVAFATCPFILKRYARDLGLTATVPTLNKDQVAVTGGSLLVSGNKVLLEDLDLNAVSNDAAITAWSECIAVGLYPDQPEWQKEFRQHFAILPDQVFSFLADTATEIRARIRIDEATRTVANGALWYEENLPAEAVLWGVMGVSRSRNKDDETTAADLAALLPQKELALQIGGKHTVGRGLCRFLVA
ncbi:type III-B CRISPR module RAMP protein Cmr4 [Zoogloea sp.]|uniref:type III-B CRISPR module RAMP protein Cmr4 n=1 Tax=Zoogloea sp. TaxID=49181 RepID=UPI002605EC29|nr:type III-B CRISPR module RAMP protein Cmr4 [Zoogloea sp.]